MASKSFTNSFSLDESDAFAKSGKTKRSPPSSKFFASTDTESDCDGDQLNELVTTFGAKSKSNTTVSKNDLFKQPSQQGNANKNRQSD